MGVYGPGTSYAAKALAGLTVLPSWRDRLAYIRIMALPGSQQLRERGGSRVGWLVRGVRRLARDRRRAQTR
jgi:hypothetical protein